MKAGLYYRVSTQDQSVDRQVDALREYCSKRGIEIAGEYIDKISGKTKKRPQLDELMKAARRRDIDCVVVLSYDRYSRSLSHLVNTLEEFQALGVNFISLKEGTDTSTPQGKLLFGIMASIAEFDRSMIVERVKSGMAAAKKRGKHLGREGISDRKAEKIRTLRQEGQSYREIAGAVGVSPATVVNYCKSL